MAIASDFNLFLHNTLSLDQTSRYQLELYLSKLNECFFSTNDWQSTSENKKLSKINKDMHEVYDLVHLLLVNNNLNEIVTEVNGMEKNLQDISFEEKCQYHKHALFFMGYCYHKGIVFQRNSDKAEFYFEMINKQGREAFLDYYIYSLKGMLGKKLDWESRYQLTFYLGQLHQDLFLIESTKAKAGAMRIAASVVKVESTKNTEDDYLIADMKKTIILLKEILDESKSLLDQKAIQDNIAKMAETLLKLNAEKQKFNKNAIFLIGYCYHRGVAVSQNNQIALVYFELAANLGFEKAQYYFLRYSIDKIGGDDKEKSTKLYQELKKIPTPEAQLHWAEKFLTKSYADASCLDAIEERRNAIIFLQKASDHGYAPAQYFFAKFYYEKCKTKSDKRWVTQHIQLAANQGWLPAIMDCVRFQWSGNSLYYNAFECLHYSQIAAGYGCSSTTINMQGRISCSEYQTDHQRSIENTVLMSASVLGAINYQGCEQLGIPRDAGKAKKYMETAASAEYCTKYKYTNISMAYHIGVCFENGFMLAENIAAAKAQYKLSWDHNAKYNLGVHYLNCFLSGKMYDEPPEIIPELFQQASAGKNEEMSDVRSCDAMHNLRICYEQGIGCDKSKKLADEWGERILYIEYNCAIHENQIQLVADKMKINSSAFRKQKSKDLKKVNNTTQMTLVSGAGANNTVTTAVDDEITVVSPTTIQPEIRTLTPYYQYHYMAYFEELKGNEGSLFKALEYLEKSILQGNQESVRRRDALLPLRNIERELQNSGQHIANTGGTFIITSLLKKVAEYAFDISTPKETNLGPFARPG